MNIEILGSIHLDLRYKGILNHARREIQDTLNPILEPEKIYAILVETQYYSDRARTKVRTKKSKYLAKKRVSRDGYDFVELSSYPTYVLKFPEIDKPG